MVLPALVKTRKNAGYRSSKNTLIILIYFSLLGLGFMFVEIVLIQKLILLLTDPLVAISAGLASLLIGAGTGGFLSFKMKNLQKASSLLILPPILILVMVLLPIITEIINGWNLTGKFLTIVGVILPVGIFLGIPFPLGIKIIGKNQKDLIPWAWAANGCLAVMAPIIAMSISLSYGYNTILWIGAILYFLAYLSLTIYQKRLKKPEY
jgi:hypothetical protein